jgi:hypothetical protein
LLVVAHVESIGQIAVDIMLATHTCISRVFFSVLQVDYPSPMISVSFLPSKPLLIGLPVTRGLIVANGKDGASEARGKSWELLPIWINEGAGITSPMRFGRPGTFLLGL